MRPKSQVTLLLGALTVNHHLVIFGNHRHCGRDKMLLVVEEQDSICSLKSAKTIFSKALDTSSSHELAKLRASRALTLSTCLDALKSFQNGFAVQPKLSIFQRLLKALQTVLFLSGSRNSCKTF